MFTEFMNATDIPFQLTGVQVVTGVPYQLHLVEQLSLCGWIIQCKHQQT